MTTEERLERIERLLIINGKEALTANEAAMFLGITEGRIRHLVSGQEIPYYKRGNRTFFAKSELERWMLSRRVKTNDEINDQAATHNVLRRMAN